MRISLGGKGPGQESKPMLSPLLLMSTNPPLTSSAGTRPARVPPQPLPSPAVTHGRRQGGKEEPLVLCLHCSAVPKTGAGVTSAPASH